MKRGRAAALGACLLGATGAVGSLFGCSSSSDNTQVDVLEVDSSQVVSLDAFTMLEKPEDHYKVENVITLDDGVQLFASGSKVAAAFEVGETADPLSTVSLLDLKTGKIKRVLEDAVEKDDGYDIYAVRASDSMLVWVESNYLTSAWSVYCASIDSVTLSLGSPMKIDQGDEEYDAPEIAVIGTTAYWVVQPAEDGSKTAEASYLKAASQGSAAATIFTSKGRFNGGLTTSGQVLTAMPRADVSGLYYQLTAFQTGTGAVIAKQIMPRSFKPACAIYMNGSFSFSISASYDNGGGIALVGTYYPLSDGEWLRLAKSPVTPAGLCHGWIYCKSGSRTVFINPNKRTYFTCDAPGSSKEYGDYSVGFGEVDSLVNYATVTKVEGSKEIDSVVVRRITPKTQA